MSTDPTRRRLLLAVGSLAVTGCIDSAASDSDESPADDGTDAPADDGTPDDADEETPDDAELPSECPESQDLDVEWPDSLDAASVESFLDEYEDAYYREYVAEYEPESMVDSYGLSARVNEGPSEAGDGYVATLSGGGGVYRPTLHLLASTATAPDGADVVAASAIEDETLSKTLTTAAETGEATHHVDDPGQKVDQYIELLAGLSADFEALTGKNEEDSLYVDVDGTTVELTAQTTSFHGDYWWEAYYYVDDHVVRRTNDEETNPQEGELLECRSPE